MTSEHDPLCPVVTTPQSKIQYLYPSPCWCYQNAAVRRDERRQIGRMIREGAWTEINDIVDYLAVFDA